MGRSRMVRKEKSAKSVATSAAVQDDPVLKLCLLQGADGSFPPPGRELAQAVGLTVERLEEVAADPHGEGWGGLDRKVFGTLVAVAALRSRFDSERDVWELQEGKALDYLRQMASGLATIDIESLVGRLGRSLLPRAD